MLERSEKELQIVRPRDLIPTVEVDLDSIHEDLHGYGELVSAAITCVAAKFPKIRSTIYVYQGASVNFHRQTWSAFFGVAGDKRLLNVLLNAFRRAKANARLSDYIDPSTATREFHVQDGIVWRPFESGTWHIELQNKTDLMEDSVPETDELKPVTPESVVGASRTFSSSRYKLVKRAPRSSAN